MTILDSVRSWGTAEDAFQIIQVQSDKPGTLMMVLQGRDAAPFALNLHKAASDPCLWLSHRMEVPTQVAELAARNKESNSQLHRAITSVENIRAGTITCSLRAQGSAVTVEIQAVIYEDGFSRHQLNAAVLEIMKARRTLIPRFEGILEGARLFAEIDQEMARQKQEFEQLTAQSAQPQSQVPPPAAGNVCPHCGKALMAGAAFCISCGTATTPPAPVPAPIPIAPPQRVCPKCGRGVPPGQNFCIACGTRV